MTPGRPWGGLTEADIIDLAGRRLDQPSELVIRGIGDDAAVIRGQAGTWLWTYDQMVEEVHFQRAWQSPAELAGKLLAVNLSDVAAMGGRAGLGLVGLALPPEIEPAWAEDFYAGLRSWAEAHDVRIVGGDTTGSPGPLMVSLALWGRAEGPVVYRSGGRPGDVLLVSRPLGAPAAALADLLAGREPRPEHRAALISPRPEVELGPFLAAAGLARAMLDLSDGLSQDAARLAQASRLAAVLEAEAVPLAAGLEDYPDPLALALHGGEEYALLWVCPPERVTESLERGQAELKRRFHPVGRLEPGQGLFLERRGRREELRPSGYDHFRRE